MFIERVFLLIIYSSSIVDLCSHQITTPTGRIIFEPYENNFECHWIFNLSLINNPIRYRALLLTFHHFDTEFGHDELLIGESIDDVSNYNSKLFRFSGWKLPDPCFIPIRDDRSPRPIWMQFLSDQTTTGSGFTLDYVFLVNQSLSLKPKSARTLINAHIRRTSSINENKTNKYKYSFPFGTISSPNYPQNYSNHIICRWDFYHRDAFIRFYIDRFHTEYHYDTLTLYLGQNLNNRAMILHEWSGQELARRHFLIPNDRVLLVFQTDKTQNHSGFLIHYEIIEKEKFIIDLYETNGTIYSKGYPVHLRTNLDYQWRIHMNESEEIEIDLTDIHLDDDDDSLQLVLGQKIYILNRARVERFCCSNETTIFFRTKHTTTDEQYRGFHLTYRKFSHQVDNDQRDLIDEASADFPCGKTFSSPNGTIELNIETTTPLTCLMLIQVDDGQNLFLRFDSIFWDNQNNQIEIGLFHFSNQSRLFRISDVMPGNWFVANESQIWIRFTSNEFALGSTSFRLTYSETIQWSTVAPKSNEEILHDHRLFPYRIVSKANVGIFQNLTKKFVWHIDALEDESISIAFRSFESFENQQICFDLSDALETSRICTSERFPLTLYRVGSWSLSIEPEFIWTLVQYEIEINKSKKVTKFYQIDLDDVDHFFLPLPNSSEPFVHLEWFVTQRKSPSTIIFDVENSDWETPADLFIVESAEISASISIDSQRNNVTKISLNSIFQKRFSHVSSSSSSKSFRIVYESFGLPRRNAERSFRLRLHKITETYFRDGDFHYIAVETNETNSEWLIEGKNETSTFIGQIFSANDRIELQTTAELNLTVFDIWKEILSSDFHLRYASEFSSRFVLILYEKHLDEQIDEPVRLTKSNGVMKTFDQISFQIEIDSQRFDLLDLIVVQGDTDMIIHLSDRNLKNQSDYFLLNWPREKNSSSSSSIIGLRFTVRTVQLDVHLRSSRHRPIELHYKARRSSSLFTDETSVETCWLSDVKVCNKHNNSRCNEHCSNSFQLKSSMMNQTKIHSYFWPYALRGSVTLIIENINLETFEKFIYRNLKQSIAKIVRKFCSTDLKNCLSEDSDAIRSDHVIIQSYDEQFDDQRLYVALFIKDPYRQSIALTNEQVLTALQEYQDELHQEIKHQIHLPTNVLEKNLLDPVWLYGVCLMALIVLLVVILMLMSVLMKRTKYRPTKERNSKTKISSGEHRSIVKQEKRLIPISIPLTNDDDDDEQTSSTDQNKTESSQTSNCTALAQLLPSSPPVAPTVSFFHFKTTPTSYFNSNIESAMIRRLEEDDEPIPFIDDNLSIANSRKSSACWSDRTSLSSRLGFSRKFNFRRSRSQLRNETIQEQDGRKRKRRQQQNRSNHLSILPQEQLRINEFV